MKRILYNTCIADPWLKVAERLQEEQDWNPVYWIGYHDDNSCNLVPEMFSGAIYHEYFSAWKGNFPEEIAALIENYTVDPDFMRELASFELQGLKIMDRMDMDGRSFSYIERQQLFRKLLRNWLAIIYHLKIDIMISASVPHRSYDFTLYLVCRKLGIPVISFIMTPFSHNGRIIGLKDIYEIPAKIGENYQEITKEFLQIELSEDINDRLERVQQQYKQAVPGYMNEHQKYHRKKPHFWSLVKKIFYEIRDEPSRWLGADGFIRKGFPNYVKHPRRDIEDRGYGLVPYMLKKLSRLRYLNQLRMEYEKNSSAPDFKIPYAFFAMHYQPEATSVPLSGIFYDQLYIIELLLKYLPEDWFIYVKENPLQFNPIAEGYTSRSLRFYRDAVRNPRVKLIPVSDDPFELIDNAEAVVTLTGTIGWEGMVRGKPVICFGSTWYEGFTDGVLKVKDDKTIAEMTDFIYKYKFSEEKLKSYLKAIENHSIRAYFYRGLQKHLKMEEKECVDNLVRYIINQIT